MSVIVVLALALGACSKGGGPAEELKSLFEMLGNPLISPSRLSTQVYSVLDEESRAAVDARAKALGDRLGTKVDPDEILQVRGLRSGARVTRVEAINRDEARATLEVSFAPIVFSPVVGADAGKPVSPTAAAPTSESEPGAAPIVAPAQVNAAANNAPMRIEVVKQSGKWRIAFLELAKFISSQPIDAAAAAGGAR